MALRRARLLAAASAQAAQPVRGKPAVAITEISAAAVREPVSRREYVIVIVRTDAGVAGVGEAFVSDAATVVAAVVDQKKRLLGRDPTAVEAARQLAASDDDIPLVKSRDDLSTTAT